MKLPYHPEANYELERAVAYYRDIDAQLAADLIAAILIAEADIESAPLRNPVAENAPDGADVRNRVLTRFAYRLVYSIEATGPLIIAFAHLH